MAFLEEFLGAVQRYMLVQTEQDWRHVLEEVHTAKVVEGQKSGCPEREQNLEMKVAVVRSQCQGGYRK